MQKLIWTLVFFLGTLQVQAEEALGEMADVGSKSFDLDLGNRLIIISIFLIVLWVGMNFITGKIKAGKFDPSKLTSLEGIKNIFSKKNPEPGDKYNINVLQNKIFADGAELMVLDINGRDILIAKTMQGGIQYITDLNSEAPREPQNQKYANTGKLQEEYEDILSNN